MLYAEQYGVALVSDATLAKKVVLPPMAKLQ